VAVLTANPAGVTIQPMRSPTEPVGLAEIAERLGVKRGTVDMWRTRGQLPAPRWTVGRRPAWNWPDVLAWALDTHRVPPATPHANSLTEA
jgi:predicted DNA-binding transcriptional regulator AlpA